MERIGADELSDIPAEKRRKRSFSLSIGRHHVPSFLVAGHQDRLSVPKITTIKPLVTKLAPRLGYLQGNERERSRYRDATQAYRQWYKTSRWQRLRWSVLVRDHVRCQRCGHEHEALTQLCCLMASLGRLDEVKGSAPDFVADHIIPHRGSPEMFWDRGNLQCICKTCHDRDKQREERRGW